METEEQEEFIKELNRDFEREDKREKTARARCLSLDYLFESEGYEPPDNSVSAEEKYIKQEEKEIFIARLHKVIDSLTPRQKEMVIMLRIFATSGLYRPDKSASYYEGTAIKAVRDTASRFQPQTQSALKPIVSNNNGNGKR